MGCMTYRAKDLTDMINMFARDFITFAIYCSRCRRALNAAGGYRLRALSQTLRLLFTDNAGV